MNDTNIVVITGAINDAGTPQQLERATKRTIRIRSLREYRQKEYDTWVDVSLWGDLASIPWLAAGVRVAVTGRLSSESWAGKDGQTKSKLVIVAISIDMLASPKQAPQQYAPQPQTYGQYQKAFQAQQAPQQAHTYQGGQWVPTQTDNNLQPPAGVIPSPGVAGGGAASSSPQAGDTQPDLPF